MFYGNVFEYGMEFDSENKCVFGDGFREVSEINSRLRRADK